MNLQLLKNVSFIVFLILESLALVSCVVLLVSIVKPVLFVISYDEADPDEYTFHYGTFYVMYNNTRYPYQEMTSHFMLTQASFSISVTLAIITVILAVMVQIFKRWKALTGYFAAVTPISLLVFAVSYTVLYLRMKRNKSFISELHSAAPVIQENGHLLDSYLLICIWPITLIFVFLAAYVLWQRFFKERNIIITLEERVPLNEY